MNGSKKRVVNESPPAGPYVIRTGFYFDDERTGPSWLEEETAIGNRRRLACRREDGNLLSTILGKTHESSHAAISLREAAEWGVLDVAEGAVLIATSDLLQTLARRIV